MPIFLEKWHDLTWPRMGPKFSTCTIYRKYPQDLRWPKSGIGINLSSKFQLKLTILVFYTKFAQQGYFQSKGD